MIKKKSAERPSTLTVEDIDRILKESRKGAKELDEQLRRVFTLSAQQRSLVLD